MTFRRGCWVGQCWAEHGLSAPVGRVSSDQWCCTLRTRFIAYLLINHLLLCADKIYFVYQISALQLENTDLTFTLKYTLHSIAESPDREFPHSDNSIKSPFSTVRARIQINGNIYRTADIKYDWSNAQVFVTEHSSGQRLEGALVSEVYNKVKGVRGESFMHRYPAA